MTIPSERTFAVIYAHAFLKDLLDPKVTPRVPKDVRATARWLLRHYPEPSTIRTAHDLCPLLFGPLPENMPSRADAPRKNPGAQK